MTRHEAWSAAFASDSDRMKRGWLAFLGSNKRFPREIMVPSTWTQGGRKRWLVRNVVELVEVLSERASKSDVWISSRSSTQFREDEPSHAHLWIDIDAQQDLELARLRAEAVSYWCKDVLGAAPYAQFSGAKGIHLHLDHAPVCAQPEQLRAAIGLLLREAGLDPTRDVDLNVVGNLRSMPRPPYTGNTNSISTYGEMLFSVPIDVSDPVETILQASREVRVSEVRIPFSPDAHRVLQEVVDEMPVRIVGEGSMTIAKVEKLCRETEAFVVRIAPYVHDGRKRFLRHLVIPAYLGLYGEDEARKGARRFVEASGADWSRYGPYTEGQIRSAHLSDGTILRPMRVRKFIVRNPDLLAVIGKNGSTGNR